MSTIGSRDLSEVIDSVKITIEGVGTLGSDFDREARELVVRSVK